MFYVGGNDIEKIKTMDLIMWEIKHDLSHIKCQLPNVILTFSEIKPRLAWNNKEIDRIRKRLNQFYQF